MYKRLMLVTTVNSTHWLP